MKSIAVIGLGIMGRGMADNFLKAGHKVVVWNRSPDKSEDLVSQGATLAASVKSAVEQAEIVIEVTANDESSRAVWLGEGGILLAAKPEQYLITSATLSTDWTDELAQTCDESGLTFFDMPMTGGRVAAESGSLTLLVGGSEQKLAEISPDLKSVSKELKYFGGAGSGMRFKLILNALQAIHLAGFGEAMKMAQAAGLDQKLVADALAERPGGISTGIARDAYAQDEAPLTFSVEWIAKDLGYADQMSASMDHPILNDVRALYQKAIDEGFSQSDWTKINKL